MGDLQQVQPDAGRIDRPVLLPRERAEQDGAPFQIYMDGTLESARVFHGTVLRSRRREAALMKIQRRSPVEAAATASGARFVETGEWRTRFRSTQRNSRRRQPGRNWHSSTRANGASWRYWARTRRGFLADSLGSGPLEIGYGHAVSWGHLYRLRQDSTSGPPVAKRRKS